MSTKPLPLLGVESLPFPCCLIWPKESTSKKILSKLKSSKENINLEEESQLNSHPKMKKATIFVQMWELITLTLKISKKKSFFKRIYQKIFWWILNLFLESSWSTRILSLKSLKYKKPDTIMKLDSIKWLQIGKNKFNLRKL